jgi:hypothetical protein
MYSLLHIYVCDLWITLHYLINCLIRMNNSVVGAFKGSTKSTQIGIFGMKVGIPSGNPDND